MKKLALCLALLPLVTAVQAQLKVASNGNAVIGDLTVNSVYDLYIYRSVPDIAFYDVGNSHFSGRILGDSSQLEITAYQRPPLGQNEPGHLILQAPLLTGGVLANFPGNVGIGMRNPGYKLSLNGNMGLYSGSTFYGSISPSNDDLLINAKFGSIINNVPPEHIILQSSSGVLLATAGNVGIGITAPNAKLHVGSNVMIGSGSPAAGYLLSVNGKIIAEELKVQLDSNWPDYVFSKDYPLLSLSEIENFIRQHGHLPNIPSAHDVISDEGFHLGDLQIRLLEKIEELTLHLINLEKEVEALKRTSIPSRN